MKISVLVFGLLAMFALLAMPIEGFRRKSGRGHHRRFSVHQGSHRRPYQSYGSQHRGRGSQQGLYQRVKKTGKVASKVIDAVDTGTQLVDIFGNPWSNTGDPNTRDGQQDPSTGY